MKAKDIFALVVRIFGLAMVLTGLSATWTAVSVLSFGRLLLRGLLWGIPYFAVAVYLLRGAPQVVGFAYPEAPTTPTDKPE